MALNLVTDGFRIFNTTLFGYTFAIPFIESKYYFFIAKNKPWNDELDPDDTINSHDEVFYNIWDEMIALKKIGVTDGSFAAKRYDWANNTVFAEYDGTTVNPIESNYYVLTDNDNVYKCIDNNRGASSTVEPTGTLTSVVTTADNYRWKYLYTISSAEKEKFLTEDYIPVKNLIANDGSGQWSVQQAASNGAIHHIKITANGTGYLSTSNTFSSITNSSVFVLKSNAIDTDDIYNGSSIYISGGLGLGQIRKIVNYVGTTRTLTVNSGFTTTPNTSSSYIVGPTVTVRGNSGVSDATRAKAYVSNLLGGQVRKITMISTGLHYAKANVRITANSSHGTGAAARPIISSPGGHGIHPISELSAISVVTFVSLSGTGSGTLPTNNEYRTIGIIRDPRLTSTGLIANTTNIDQTYRLTILKSGAQDFIADEIVTGAISGARGSMLFFANTVANKSQGTLRLTHFETNGIGGHFVVGETVTGETSGISATVAQVHGRTLKPYTGSLLYKENRIPVERDEVQTETVKIVINF